MSDAVLVAAFGLRNPPAPFTPRRLAMQAPNGYSLQAKPVYRLILAIPLFVLKGCSLISRALDIFGEIKVVY